MLTLKVWASNIGARSLHRKNSILPPVAVPSSDVQKQSREFDRTILRKAISQWDEDNNIVLRGKDEGECKFITYIFTFWKFYSRYLKCVDISYIRNNYDNIIVINSRTIES